MHIFNVLIGSSEDLFNSCLERAIEECCPPRTIVQATARAYIDGFIEGACDPGLDLAIIVPDKLRPDAAQPAARGSVLDSIRALRSVRSQSLVPILALTEIEEYATTLREAGADQVLGLPLNRGAAAPALRRLLRLPEPAETHGGFLQWVLRLKPAGTARGRSSLTPA